MLQCGRRLFAGGNRRRQIARSPKSVLLNENEHRSGASQWCISRFVNPIILDETVLGSTKDGLKDDPGDDLVLETRCSI